MLCLRAFPIPGKSSDLTVLFAVSVLLNDGLIGTAQRPVLHNNGFKEIMDLVVPRLVTEQGCTTMLP